MSEKSFKKAVIKSFFNAKTHISTLEDQVECLKSLILRQNDIIRQLTERIIEHSKLSQKAPNEPFFYSSSGNEGVKQSINQSINQALSTKSPEIVENNDFLSNSPSSIQKSSFPPKKTQFLGSPQAEHEVVKPEELSENSQKRVKTLQKDILDENFQAFKINLNQAFSKLSKQELNAFLTVYQLDEANGGVSYGELAEKMGLTETCIRAYISSLFKKGLPLIKTKINNKKTIIAIKGDFKALNLKSRIISLYYEKDPYQTSLFDVKN